MSLNFVILRHLGVISHQERPLQKSYKVDFTSLPCLRTHMHFARLVKIVKFGIYFKTSHDAFKSYSCH